MWILGINPLAYLLRNIALFILILRAVFVPLRDSQQLAPAADFRSCYKLIYWVESSLELYINWHSLKFVTLFNFFPGIKTSLLRIKAHTEVNFQMVAIMIRLSNEYFSIILSVHSLMLNQIDNNEPSYVGALRKILLIPGNLSDLAVTRICEIVVYV